MPSDIKTVTDELDLKGSEEKSLKFLAEIKLSLLLKLTECRKVVETAEKCENLPMFSRGNGYQEHHITKNMELRGLNRESTLRSFPVVNVINPRNLN